MVVTHPKPLSYVTNIKTHRDRRVLHDVEQHGGLACTVVRLAPHSATLLAEQHLNLQAFCSGVVVHIGSQVVVWLERRNLQSGPTYTTVASHSQNK